MNQKQVGALIKASPRIFVWAQLSENVGAYLSVSKASLIEFLTTISVEDDFFVEIDEEGHLYLGGRPDLA